jgi:hypothetical protein
MEARLPLARNDGEWLTLRDAAAKLGVSHHQDASSSRLASSTANRLCPRTTPESFSRPHKWPRSGMSLAFHLDPRSSNASVAYD